MQKKILLTILLIFFLPFIDAHSSAFATIFYVAKNGSDSNPGTEAEPWLTIQKAADTMVAGDSVYIKAGTYKTRVIPKNSGSVGNYITYQNYPGDEVILDASGNAAVFVENLNYLRFVGIILRGGSIAGFYAEGPVSNLILDGLTSENNNYGIYFNAFNAPIRDGTIKNCEVKNNDNHGIFLYRSNYDILIDNNHVSYNAWDHNWGHNIKVVVWNGDGPSTGPVGITVTNNELDHARVQGIMTWNARDLLIKDNHFHHNGASGIQIEDGSKNVIIEGNICEHNAQRYDTETGIWIDDSEHVLVQNNILRHNKIGLLIGKTDHCVVRNNVIYENDVSTVDPSGILIVYAKNKNSIVVHNTIYKNGKSGSNADGIALGTWGQIDSAVIKNNIVSETNSECDLEVNCNSYTSDYNDYYNTRDLLIDWRGSDNTWAQYVSKSGQDSHSITQNPLFENPDNANFHLQSDSPCIDRGSFLTKTTTSGSGKVIKVEDARYFTYGYGLTHGDLIKVGTNASVRITNVEYGTNAITVDKSIYWNNGDAVSYPYLGSAPDIGAYEYGGGVSKPPSPTGLRVVLRP